MCKFESDCVGTTEGSNGHCMTDSMICNIAIEKRRKIRALRAFNQSALVVV